MAQQLLTYWLIAQLFGLAGLPLARALFHALPDRGYAFAKSLGLLLAGYAAWLIAMLGLASFGAPLVVACTVLVAAAGLLAERAASRAPAVAEASRSHGFRAAPFTAHLVPLTGVRVGWRTVLGYEALFALALLFLALLRSHDLGFVGPHPWGTERPMDYALFNAIRQSERFPPHDPWMSGYSINYYYFGYLLMAAVAAVSGQSPAVAYNLSLALIFALAALGAAGIVNNLVGLTRPASLGERAADPREHMPSEEQRPAEPRRGRRAAKGRWPAIVLAVLLLLFAGNQGGALQVIVGDERVAALDGHQLVSALAQALAGAEEIVLPHAVTTGDFGEIAALTRSDRAADFNWWWPSRSVWDTYRECDPATGACATTRSYVITEFPFFSFWLGDMHPHVMALPFGLLAMALALNTIARPALPDFAASRRGWLELALTSLALGSLYVLNSWDLPTYLLLFAGALAVRFCRRPAEDQRPRTRNQGPRTEDQHLLDVSPASLVVGRSSLVFPWRAYARQLVPVLAAAFALFLPFHLTFRSLVGGREPLIDVPLIGSLTRTIGVVTWGRTELHQFLIIFGLFLLPLVAYVLAQARRTEDHGPRTKDQGDHGSRNGGTRWSAVGGLLALAIPALLVGVLLGFPLLFLLPLGLAAARLAFARAGDPPAALTLGAFALGCAICFGVEIIYIRDGFESRLNTIFKFYYQVWLIWSVLAAYALWWLVHRVTAHRQQALAQGMLVTFSLVPFAVLLAGSLVYPWLTTAQAFGEGRQVGLAGVTPRERTPEGAAAIAWLRQNAPGDAVILEAVGPAYDTGSLGIGGVSSSTGLATVMGWEGHQVQWRGGQPELLAQIGPRAADVAAIYSTTDVEHARRLLRQYGVRFIYVGAAERVTYPPAGLDKLSQLGTPVFQQGEVTIYQVEL